MGKGTTDERYNQVQSAAMKTVARWGVESYDALPNKNARNAVSLGWRVMLMQETGIGNAAAQRHIAKAVRRQQHPNWDGNCDAVTVLDRGRTEKP